LRLRYEPFTLQFPKYPANAGARFHQADQRPNETNKPENHERVQHLVASTRTFDPSIGRTVRKLEFLETPYLTASDNTDHSSKSAY
jgi:hypothetical protein